jgi:MFS family permease
MTGPPDPAAAGPGPLSTARGRLALGLLCSAFLVDVMGATSVFTASPAIERALGLSPAGLQWTFTAATLPAGALLLAGGRLADRFGPRRMFLTGLGLLLGASLACGLAAGPVVLICARAAQGAAGAVLMPAALSLVISTFDGEAEQRTALAAWSAIGGIGATCGLLLGGAVAAGLGWRWVFLINVPVTAVMLAIAPLILAQPAGRSQPGSTGSAGMLSFSGGLALVIYAISQAPGVGWLDWRTTGLGLAGVAMLGVFARTEAVSATPIVPSWLVRSRRLMAGNVTMVVAGMCVDGLLFILTLLTQRIWGYSALEFGGAAAVMTITSVGASWAAQRAIATLGTGPVTTVGLGLLCLTGVIFVMTATASGNTKLLLAGMVVFGAGMGLVFVAGSVASLHGVSEENSGVASAVQTISFTMGSAVGVAVVSTVAAATTEHLSSHGVTLATLTSGYRAALVGVAVVAALGLAATTAISGQWRGESGADRQPRRGTGSGRRDRPAAGR